MTRQDYIAALEGISKQAKEFGQALAAPVETPAAPSSMGDAT